MSKKSKHKPKGPKNPPQNAPPVTETAEIIPEEQQPPQQAEIIVQREPQNAQKPEHENTPEIIKEESAEQSEDSPVKPKRNRNNRKKKNNNQESPEESKPQEPPIQPPQEEVKDVKPEVKEQPEKQDQKSKKGGKKDKKEQKNTQAPEENPVVEVVEPVVAEPPPSPVVVEDDFVEEKGGKNKKGKNKKNKENKEVQHDGESVKKDTDVKEAKPEEKSPKSEIKDVKEKKVSDADIKETKPKELKEIPEIKSEPSTPVLVEQADTFESVQKNKKGKKNNQSKQKQNKETTADHVTNEPNIETVEPPKAEINIEEKSTCVKPEEQTKLSASKSDDKMVHVTESSQGSEKDKKNEAKEQKPSNKKDGKSSKSDEKKKNKNQVASKIDEGPKPEKIIAEATDDILPALASSIEKTLEELIVCESDLLLNEQLKNEEEKKDKNKKKSKKEKHIEKLEPVMEDREKPAEIAPPQPDIIGNIPEIKTDVTSEIETNKDSEIKVIADSKTEHLEVKRLDVQERKSPSKSPTRKDKRNKSPKPKSSENTEQIQNVPELKQEIQPLVTEHVKTENLEVKHLDVQERKSPSKSPTRKDRKSKSPKPKSEGTEQTENRPESKQEIHPAVTEHAKTEKLEVKHLDIQERKSPSKSPTRKDKRKKSPKPKSDKDTEQNKNTSEIKQDIHQQKGENTSVVTEEKILENVSVESKNIAEKCTDPQPNIEIKSDLNIVVSSVPEEIINTLLSDTPPTNIQENIVSDEQKIPKPDAANRKKNKSKERAKKIENEPVKNLPVELDSDAGSNQIESNVEKEMKKALEVAIGVAVGGVPINENVDTAALQKSTPDIKSDTVEEQKICEKGEQNKQDSKSKSKKNKNKQSSQEETKTTIEKEESKDIEVPKVGTCPILACEYRATPEQPIVSSIITSPSTPTLPIEIPDEKQQRDYLKPGEQKHRTPSPKPNKRNKGKKNKQEGNDVQELQAEDKSDNDQNKPKDNKDEKEETTLKQSEVPKQEQQIEKTEVAPTPDTDKKCEKQQEVKEGKGKNKQPKNQSKNLVGPTDNPAKSSKLDYKKEKNKNEGEKPASKTDKSDSGKNVKRPIPSGSGGKVAITELQDGKLAEDDDEEFVYKYSFRTVFIANACHICKAALKDDRVVCRFCHLVSYCSEKHRDDDWQAHQSICYAICTISHAKEQNYIYGDAKTLNGHDYRLLRMQTIVSCEKMLKRKLSPWEQEALLYPRICSLPSCREWKSGLLKDCEGCGQVSYCSANPTHLPADHVNWCRAYKLYYKLVAYQLNHGRLEPELPSKIPPAGYLLPDASQTLFQDLYDNIANMEECNYATLTQLSTAPLTALYAYQKFKGNCSENASPDKPPKQNFCIHLIGAELQFEGDTLKKWEVFFMHLMHHVKELTVVLIGPELNVSKLPVELLGKIKMCQSCKQEERKIKFDFAEGMLYHDYVESAKFIRPDIICAFNPGFHRATGYADLDTWPETIASALRLKVPLCMTAYTSHEMPRDLERVKACAPHKDKLRIILPPGQNPYSSLRPDRNFVSDDEMPLIFKNYHISLVISD